MSRRRRKQYYTLPPYSIQDEIAIELAVERFKERYPDLSDLEIRIREILSRFKGEAGLKESRVLYLLGSIMRVINQDNAEYRREMGPTYYD